MKDGAMSMRGSRKGCLVAAHHHAKLRAAMIAQFETG
jgi:hypothetical protein